MNIFDQIGLNLNSIAQNIDTVIAESMYENRDEIIDINVGQLEEGVASDGGVVGEYASDTYAQLKQALGSKAPTGIVDTKLEGDYHEGFYAELHLSGSLSGLIIGSNDSKADKLESKYQDLYGIAPTNIDKLDSATAETIQNKIKDEITRT